MVLLRWTGQNHRMGSGGGGGEQSKAFWIWIVLNFFLISVKEVEVQYAK